MLFTPKRSVQQDGSIISTCPPSYIPGPYHYASPPQPTSLVALCIQALHHYPDQVHHLPLRIYLRNPSLIHQLVPDPLLLDPRLWATLIQVYDGLPAHLASFSLPLADTHLPLLQSIPSTPTFSLLTLLSLPACSQLTDETITQLKFLHTLTAFDASNTSISSYAITSLVATLQIEEDDHSAREHRGPWQIRLLSLRNCRKITNDAFPAFVKFPLLSVLDLRGTSCRPDASIPFKPCDLEELYHPSSLETAISKLYETQPKLFSSDNPFILNINTLYHRPTKRPPVNLVAPQDAFLVIPSSSSSRIQVGNVNVLEKQIKVEEDAIAHEKNKSAWYERQRRLESRSDFLQEPSSHDKLNASRLPKPFLQAPKHRSTTKTQPTRPYVTSFPLPPIRRQTTTTGFQSRPSKPTDISISHPLRITNGALPDPLTMPLRSSVNASGGASRASANTARVSTSRTESDKPRIRSRQQTSSTAGSIPPRGAEATLPPVRRSCEAGLSSSSASSASRIPQPLLKSARTPVSAPQLLVGVQDRLSAVPPSVSTDNNGNVGVSATSSVGDTNSRSGTSLLAGEPQSASNATSVTSERFYRTGASSASSSLAVPNPVSSGASRLRNSSVKPRYSDPIPMRNSTSKLAERAINDIPPSDASLRLYRHAPPWSALQDAVAQTKEREKRRLSKGSDNARKKPEVAVLNMNKMEKAKRAIEEMMLETTRTKRRKVDFSKGGAKMPPPSVFSELATGSTSKNPFRKRTASDPTVPTDTCVSKPLEEDDDDFSNLGREDSDDRIENDDNFGPIPTPKPAATSSKRIPVEPPQYSKGGDRLYYGLPPAPDTPEIWALVRENERKALGLTVSQYNKKLEEARAKRKPKPKPQSERRQSTGSSSTSKAQFDWKKWGKS
ncbi:hypothetical protein CPC08DRAFT_684882 [Agrocybe pediades]|nr:hypothetical protein CPC08DRAFT_684882 [Agrocybe pediades]